MKKIFALVLAALMLLSMTAALADDPDYSITVNNAKEGETYKAYKMFDLSVDDPTNPTAYRYTVNSAWDGFKTDAAFTAAFTVDSQGYVSAKSGVTSEANWVAGSVMSTLAEKAAKYAVDHSISPADSQTVATGSTSVKLNTTEAGYYIVTSTLGTRAMIQTTPAATAVTINEKNEGDTIDKTVKEDSTGAYGDNNDAQVGDTVDFKSVTTIVPRSIKVKIHDTMDAGLDLIADSIKVYSTYDAEDPTKNVEYSGATIRTAASGEGAHDSGDTFTIDIPDTFAATATANQTLTVIYQAKLNEKAVVKDGAGQIVIQDNKTRVTWGDNTGSSYDTTHTTTHNAMIHKYTGSDATTTTELADAIFELKKNGTRINLVKIDAQNYRIVTATETGSASTHVAANNEVATIAAGSIVSDFVTVSAGKITIWGLDSDSDYTVTEIQAPKGYNLVSGAQTLTYDSDNGVFLQTNVQNQTGSTLPSTGGIGTTIFYIAGSILVLAAAILLITKRRMGNND